MGVSVENPQDLLSVEPGTALGHSDWLMISQERIDHFADATGDHQWIHVDPDRAKDGPFGACIAHGFLTLALVNHFLPELLEVRKFSSGVNYGCDRVRFPAPVPVGSKIRGVGEVLSVKAVEDGAQVAVRVTIEIEGAERPGCVVDTISRFYN